MNAVDLKSTTKAADELDFSNLIQPVTSNSIFKEAGYNVWCGSVIRAQDGQYHLFYSRWKTELGHLAWVTHSEIARAVSDKPGGPFKHSEVVLPPRSSQFWDGHCTHNPTIYCFNNKYYLYYTGNHGDGKVVHQDLNWTHRNNQRIGVAVADSPDGPWKRFDHPLLNTTPGFHDALCLANPSILQRSDGSFLMIYKAVADKGAMPFGGPVVHVVAISDSPTGPFNKLPDPVFTSQDTFFPAEDPYIWRGKDAAGNDKYWAIVKDMSGNFTKAGVSLALFESQNGVDWGIAAKPLVSTLKLKWADQHQAELSRLERPQLYLENSQPVMLYCAASEQQDFNNSFNIQIPLKPDV